MKLIELLDNALGIYRTIVNLAFLLSACVILIRLRLVFVYSSEIIFHCMKYRLLRENQTNMLGTFCRGAARITTVCQGRTVGIWTLNVSRWEI